jgi:hypothetical protein
MNRKMMFLILFALGSIHLAAQNTCAGYDFQISNTKLVYADAQQHQAGDHNATMQGTLSCQYYGDNTHQYCSALLNIYPAATDAFDEWGSLDTIYDCHPLAFGVKSNSAFAEGQAGPVTETTVFGVNDGLLLAGKCVHGPLSITVTGVGQYSFSPNDRLWSAEQDYQGQCDAKVPTYCVQPTGGCGLRYHWDGEACACVYNGGSPILIDTKRTGYKLSPPYKSQPQLIAESEGRAWLGDPRDTPPNEEGCVNFDLTGDGEKKCWSWPVTGSGNGWLVRINNGKIDNGTKLFGDHTPVGCSETAEGGGSLPRGFWNCSVDQPDNPNIRSGYFAAEQFDMLQSGGNGDSVLSKDDEVWPYLRICIDDNPRDGVCTEKELHTLEEFGIHSLSLVALPSGRQDRWKNTFKYEAEINPDSANVGTMAQQRALEIHERAMAKANDADIANAPTDPWLSYDVWLVNSDAGK